MTLSPGHILIAAGLRAACFAASACLAASCNIPGMQVDESGLGPPTPLARQVSILYPAAPYNLGTRSINEWFRETCPQVELPTILECATASGFVCRDPDNVSEGEALCSYEGSVRTRSIGFSVAPSIDGAPTSEWSTGRITVQLFSGDAAPARLEWMYASAD